MSAIQSASSSFVNAGLPVAAATARVRAGRTPKAGDLSCAADPVQALQPGEAVGRLKASKILSVGDNKKSGPAAPFFEIPLEHVGRFERDLHEMMDLKQAALLAEIGEKKDLPEEIQKKLHAVAKEFAASFKRS